jgi:hypothetical protein
MAMLLDMLKRSAGFLSYVFVLCILSEQGYAGTVVVSDNLGDFVLCDRSGFDRRGPESKLTATEFYSESIGGLRPGFDLQHTYEYKPQNPSDIGYFCFVGRSWYLTNETPEEFRLRRRNDLLERLRQNTKTWRGRVEENSYRSRIPNAAVTGFRGSVINVELADLIEASDGDSGYVTFKTIDDVSFADLVPFALPIGVMAAAPGDWFEIHADGELVTAGLLSDFELNRLYQIEIPDEVMTAIPPIQAWTIYLVSAGNGRSELMLPIEFEEVTDPVDLFGLLLAKVIGQDPGTSLADKILSANTYYEVTDIQSACLVMTEFEGQVRALSGKRRQGLSAEFAAELIEDSIDIRVFMGCANLE